MSRRPERTEMPTGPSMRTKHLLRCVLVGALGFALLASGCSDDSGPRNGTGGPTTDPQACTAGVVPHRLGFSWARLNHRISKWDHQLGDVPEGNCAPSALTAEFIGGPFSGGMDSSGRDTPTLKYGFRSRQKTDDPSIGFARRSVEVSIDPSGVASGTRSYSREKLQLRHYPTVVAVVEGFRIDTDVEQGAEYPDNYDPADGYTVHALGASVAVPSSDESSLTLEYRLQFQPGTSPDRDPHNRAVPHARVAGRLDVLLVGIDDDVPSASGSVDYRVDYTKPSPGSEQEFPPAAEEKRRIVLDGAQEKPLGLWGIRSFQFEFSPRIDCVSDTDCPAGETCRDEQGCTQNYGEPGFYLRELSVDIELRSYQRDSGRATFSFNGYASNDTDFIGFWPMRNEFSGEMVWLQSASDSETVRYESTFETGRTDVSLDAMRE